MKVIRRVSRMEYISASEPNPPAGATCWANLAGNCEAGLARDNFGTLESAEISSINV
jgi:hypothetical protein